MARQSTLSGFLNLSSSGSTIEVRKRRSDYKTEREMEREWLYFNEEADGMFCKVCRRWDKKPRSSKALWNTVPCICVRLNSVHRHEPSEQHIEAVELNNIKLQSEKDGGIAACFDKVWEEEEKSLKSALMCLYWLCKEEIAQTSKFSKLLDLVDLLNKNVLLHLNKGGNAHYRSHRSISEFLTLISSTISSSNLYELNDSPFFSLMINETTDLSTTKQLIIYARYLVRPKDTNGVPLGGVSVWTRYLALKDLSQADAESVTNALCTVLDEKYMIDKHILKCKLAGFGSDGANVMIGKHAGVSAKLKKIAPTVISVHCAAHKLALAASESANQVGVVNRYKGLVNSMFHYLHQSPARSSRFIEVQQALNMPELKLKEAKDVRWLSCSQAVNALKKNLLPLSIFMSSEAEDGNATALGLATALVSYEFIAGTFFIAEVLPHLSRLSLCFQEERLLWHEVPALLNATLEVLDNISASSVTASSEWQQILSSYLQNAEEEGILVTYSAIGRRGGQVTPDSFVAEFCIPYLDVLRSNLKARFPPEDVTFLSTFQVFDPALSLPIEKQCELLRLAAKQLSLVTTEEETDIYDSLRSEYASFSIVMKQKGYVDSSEVMRELASSLVPVSSDQSTSIFPLLGTLAARLLVIPASTADCERGFSALNRIKTSTGNRLIPTTLDELLMIDLEGRDIAKFDFDAVVKAWATGRNRRLFT